MKHYIDKDALVVRIKKLKMDIGNIFSEYDERFWEGRITAFDDVICALDNLEVKEMDFERELFYEDYIGFFKEHPNFPDDWGFDDAWVFAKYFFELGLKVAQKGE